MVKVQRLFVKTNLKIPVCRAARALIKETIYDMISEKSEIQAVERVLYHEDI